MAVLYVNCKLEAVLYVNCKLEAVLYVNCRLTTLHVVIAGEGCDPVVSKLWPGQKNEQWDYGFCSLLIVLAQT